MICSSIFADVIDVACAWEIIFKLMERAGHDSVSQVKSLLDSITMMDININI